MKSLLFFSMEIPKIQFTMPLSYNEYDLATEDLFQMSARSFYVGDGSEKEIWLNFPEQLAVRDILTGQFTFDGLFYSDYPTYDNN
jgi:hypothetical protein